MKLERKDCQKIDEELGKRGLEDMERRRGETKKKEEEVEVGVEVEVEVEGKNGNDRGA